MLSCSTWALCVVYILLYLPYNDSFRGSSCKSLKIFPSYHAFTRSIEQGAQQVWQSWRQKIVAEDALKESIRLSKSEDAIVAAFEEFRNHIHHDKEEIFLLNYLFFRAQATGDMGIMKSLWLNSQEILCTTNMFVKGHVEGVNVIGGHRNITSYFTKYTPTLRDYTLRDLRLKYYGRLAVVTCTVDTHAAQSASRYRPRPVVGTSSSPRPGTIARGRGAVTATNYVTNVFERRCDEEGFRYVLVSHSASIHPGTPSEVHKGVAAVLRSTYRDPTRPKALQPGRGRRRADLSLDFQELSRIFSSRGSGGGSEDLGAGLGFGEGSGGVRADLSDDDVDSDGDESGSDDDDGEGDEDGGAEEENDEEMAEEDMEAQALRDPSSSAGRDLERAKELLRRLGATGPGLSPSPSPPQGQAGRAVDGLLDGSASRTPGEEGVQDEEVRRHRERMARLRDAVLRTLSSLAGQPGMLNRRGGSLLVISSPISTAPSSSGGSGGSSASDKASSSSASKETDKGEGSEEDRDDDRLPAEERALLRKLLTARALHCLGHLHRSGRLTLAEKTLLSAELIETISDAEAPAQSVPTAQRQPGQPDSEVLVAYSLLMLGARPDDGLLRALAEVEAPGSAMDGLDSDSEGEGDEEGELGPEEQLAAALRRGYDEVPAQDTEDFVRFCHRRARQLQQV